MGTELNCWFDHGLGDCVHWAALMQLYKRRGFDVRVHYEGNKAPVFEAAGLPYLEEHVNYHHWRYYDGFNHPDPAHEGSGNKTYLNLNTEWLPDLGDRDDLWRELCGVDMEDSFDPQLPRVKRQVDRFLEHLPRPVVALHTNGTNFAPMKSIPPHVSRELYRLLIDGGCSVVLLDWDNRVPLVPHGRIRHLKNDWGHVDVLQLAGLLSAVDLLIGIDSGPFHLCHMTRTPSLGVFHDFFPWCVTLPRPSGKTAVMTRDSHRHCTRERRALWNPVEYAAPKPTAQDIARHALRMVAGPRYGLPIGRDVMLQQWVRDWCPSSTSTSPIADRNNSLDFLFKEMSKMENPAVVETGCVRSQDDWSAGYFGYICGAYLDGRNAGKLVSVDIDAGNCDTARRLCQPWGDHVDVVTSDSVAFLETRTDPIDVLYLDSLDCEESNHAAHGLKEIKAAERLLTPSSVVVWDDTVWNMGWRGKGSEGIPYMLARGWRVVFAGYQTVLKRC